MTVGPKRLGCCLACQRECYTVIEMFVAGPREGEPRTLGAQLDHGLQVTFLLSDRSEADVTFCRDCAATLTSADYPAIWTAVVDKAEQILGLSGLSPNQMRDELGRLLRLRIVGQLGWRKENPHRAGELVRVPRA